MIISKIAFLHPFSIFVRILTKEENLHTKVSFFLQCSKMQIISIKEFNIKTCFFQFLWVFRMKCWFKGQIISRIHLSLPNAYTLMCFHRNINRNRDDKFFEWDYWSLHWYKKLTLIFHRLVSHLQISIEKCHEKM